MTIVLTVHCLVSTFIHISHVCRNLTRPTLVKNVAKGILDLCTSDDAGDREELLELRRQIVGGLVSSLLEIEAGTDSDRSNSDNVSKGLRKVMETVLLRWCLLVDGGTV